MPECLRWLVGWLIEAKAVAVAAKVKQSEMMVVKKTIFYLVMVIFGMVEALTKENLL